MWCDTADSLMPAASASALTFSSPAVSAEMMRTRLVSLKARNSSATWAAVRSSSTGDGLTVGMVILEYLSIRSYIDILFLAGVVVKSCAVTHSPCHHVTASPCHLPPSAFVLQGRQRFSNCSSPH